MPAAYSLDLRQRVWALYQEGGRSQAEVAAHFKVSESFVRDLARRARENKGSVAPRPHGGGWPKPANGEQLARIKEVLTHKNDLTLEELRRELRRRHKFKISVTSLWRVLRAMGLSFKKEGPACERT